MVAYDLPVCFAAAAAVLLRVKLLGFNGSELAAGAVLSVRAAGWPAQSTGGQSHR